MYIFNCIRCICVIRIFNKVKLNWGGFRKWVRKQAKLKIFGFVITAALVTTTMVGTANAQTTTNNYKVAGNANTVFTDVPRTTGQKMLLIT